MELLSEHADKLKNSDWFNKFQKDSDWFDKFNHSHWKEALLSRDSTSTLPNDSTETLDPTVETATSTATAEDSTSTASTEVIDSTVDTAASEPTSTVTTEVPAPTDTVDDSTSTSSTPVIDPTMETASDQTSTVTTDDPAPTDTVDDSMSTSSTPVIDPTMETAASDQTSTVTTEDPAPTDTVDDSTSTSSAPVIDPTMETAASDQTSTVTTEDPAASEAVDDSTSTSSTPVIDPTMETAASDQTSTATTEDPAASEAVDASTSTESAQPAPGLTYTTTPIHSEYDGQVIENLDIYVTNGDAVTITHDNVILRNCRIHHVEGDGVMVSGATGVTIENSEVINADPPQGIDPETSENIINISAEDAPNLTVQNTTVREGSTGIYLVNSPGADLSHVDGYDFHGPFPRGQFVQFNNSGNSSLTDFYAVNNADGSHPEDIVSVYASPNTTISNGVIDGNNSVTGVGVMFENGSTGGRVENVDAIHQANGGFSSYVGDVTFDDTRSFDSLNEDQGRGLPSSNGLIWNVSSGGVSILNSSYTNPGNPDNIVWDRSQAVVADVQEDPTATPMAHIDNQFAWDYAA